VAAGFGALGIIVFRTGSMARSERSVKTRCGNGNGSLLLFSVLSVPMVTKDVLLIKWRSFKIFYEFTV
jgi:hypothetical protein